MGSQGEDAGVAEQASAPVRDRDSSELVSDDAGDPIVTGQSFVHEGVVAVEQLEQASVLANQRVEEELRLATHRIPEPVVELWVATGIGVDHVEAREPESLRGEPRAQRLGTRIGEQPPYLMLEYLWVLQLLVLG